MLQSAAHSAASSGAWRATGTFASRPSRLLGMHASSKVPAQLTEVGFLHVFTLHRLGLGLYNYIPFLHAACQLGGFNFAGTWWWAAAGPSSGSLKAATTSAHNRRCGTQAWHLVHICIVYTFTCRHIHTHTPICPYFHRAADLQADSVGLRSPEEASVSFHMPVL